MKPSERGPKTRRRPPDRLSFRSSSPPSTSATTSSRCFGGWRRRSQASPLKSSSSMTIPPTAPGTWCGAWRGKIPASAVSGGSAAAACPAPASRASWPRARPAPLSSMPTCSMTRRNCQRCWRCCRLARPISWSAAAISMVALDFLGLVLAKLTNDVVSLRFLLFAMVGSTGLFVHLAALFVALEMFDLPFPEAQACAALLAMTSNFILNNFLTYRDQRLKGFAILRGLLLFYLVCSVGLVANVGVAFSVSDQEPLWCLAGAARALMGVVWYYAMSGLFVWRKR